MADGIASWNPPAGIRALAFDLDGTLLDTLPDIADAANAMLRDLGRDEVHPDIVRSYIGDGIPRLVKRLLVANRDGEPATDAFERARAIFQDHYFRHLDRYTRAYDGAREGVERMRDAGLRLACVTNKAERFARPLLDAHFGAGAFDLVVGGDTLPRKKPDPLPFVHCCEQFDVAADELLVVGDSANDVDSARAAGCPVVCVPYGYTGGADVRSLGADAIVPGILQVADRLCIAQS